MAAGGQAAGCRDGPVVAGPLPSYEDQVRDALRLVIADFGDAALSSPQTISEVLDDLLPDAPAGKALLVAAAEANLAGQLRELLHQGMDANTAARLAAFSFASATTFTAGACSWAADAFAEALGAGPGPSRRAGSQDAPQPPLVHADPGAWTTRQADVPPAPARRRRALGCLAGTRDDGLAGVRECGAPRRSVPPADSPRGTPRVRRSSRVAERRSRRAGRRPGRQRPGASGEDAPTPPHHLVSRRDRVPPRLEDTGRRRARRQRASRPCYPAHRKTAPRQVAQRPPLPAAARITHAFPPGQLTRR